MLPEGVAEVGWSFSWPPCFSVKGLPQSLSVLSSVGEGVVEKVTYWIGSLLSDGPRSSSPHVFLPACGSEDGDGSLI